MAGRSAPDFWNNLPPTMLARALAPVGAVWGAATAWRMRWRGVQLSCPVICIGNFTAGGTGKTPMALAVAKRLQEQGRTPYFLTRGYGGTARRHPLRVDLSVHSALDVGDEPLLLARIAPAIVGADRLAAARMALAHGADVLVMDDGLQNPALAKTLAFAIVDGAVGFGNGLCLPAGPLRAPLAWQWPFAHAVVVVGSGAAGEIAAKSAKAAGKPVLRALLEPDAGVAASLQGQRVVAFAGIGRPAKFFDSLAATGAEILACHAFPDHHVYQAGEINALQSEALEKLAVLATTEKDLARTGRWPGKVQPTALPVDLAIEKSATLDALIANALAAFKPGGQSA